MNWDDSGGLAWVDIFPVKETILSDPEGLVSAPFRKQSDGKFVTLPVRNSFTTD